MNILIIVGLLTALGVIAGLVVGILVKPEVVAN